MFRFLIGVAFGAAGYWAWQSFGRDLLGMGGDQETTYGGFNSNTSSFSSGTSGSSSYGTSGSSSTGSSGSATPTGSTMGSSESPTRRALGALVSGDERQIDLARAALLIAAEEYPDLEPRHYLDQLDRLGQALRARLVHESAPERQIAALNALLFGEEGFRGNEASYYDPRNSYLNQVLDRRLGLPITLALIYVEVGRRARLPLSGVGFPAHFLVVYEAEPRLLVDPFNCGRLLSASDCQQLLWQAFGSSARLEPGQLAVSPPREILARLISNLKVAYQ
ncbi:MAG: hypothetical protein E6I75_31275, partial [Chloroflexi bacterium]